jgi:hypothetical protein
MSVIDHQHAHTVRLEAVALQKRATDALGELSEYESSGWGVGLVLAVLALCKRVELVESALRGREA